MLATIGLRLYFKVLLGARSEVYQRKFEGPWNPSKSVEIPALHWDSDCWCERPASKANKSSLRFILLYNSI